MSQWRTGACLSFGKTWETAHPVAFDSQQMNAQHQKYPTHKQRLLAIIWALMKWQVDLLGTPINIYTDHCTLENFDMQRDLSQRQCCWQEFLSQYDYTIIYIKGEKNTVANTMSHIPNEDTVNNALPTDPNDILLAALFSITADDAILKTIKTGYDLDPFCVKLHKSPNSCPGLTTVDGMMYISGCLVIPRHGDIHKTLFLLAHNSLGHFGFEKSYRSLKDSYYWPNMRKDLEEMYIPSCASCQ